MLAYAFILTSRRVYSCILRHYYFNNGFCNPSNNMKNPKCPCLITCGVILSAVGTELVLGAAERASVSIRTVSVNRKVSDFPTGEDLSTPEAAYVGLLRAYAAEGDAAYARLSITELAKDIPLDRPSPCPLRMLFSGCARRCSRPRLRTKPTP